MVMVFFYWFCSLKSHVYCRKCVVVNESESKMHTGINKVFKSEGK